MYMHAHAQSGDATRCSIVTLQLHAMEVLVEFKGSRRQLTLSNSTGNVLEEISNALGKTVVLAKAESSQPKSTSPTCAEYLLQRWSGKWDTYVDVDNLSEITDGDRLTVILKPCGSPAKVCCALPKLKMYF